MRAMRPHAIYAERSLQLKRKKIAVPKSITDKKENSFFNRQRKFDFK
jgi:hypothetical protein